KIKFLSWKYCGISNWRTSKLFCLSLNNTDFFEYSVLYLCLAINRFQKLSSVPDMRIFKFKWLMTSPSTKRDFKISISACAGDFWSIMPDKSPNSAAEVPLLSSTCTNASTVYVSGVVLKYSKAQIKLKIMHRAISFHCAIKEKNNSFRSMVS